MKRNIIKLDKGKISIEKKKVVRKEKSEKERNVENTIIAEALSIGITIVLPIAGGVMIGAIIDKMIGSSPKGTLGLLFLGVFVSFIKMYQLVDKTR